MEEWMIRQIYDIFLVQLRESLLSEDIFSPSK